MVLGKETNRALQLDRGRANTAPVQIPLKNSGEAKFFFGGVG